MRNIFLLTITLLMFSACSQQSELNRHDVEQIFNESGKETNNPTDDDTSESSMSVTEILTEKELIAFEYLRSDWTKEQMSELGLEVQVSEQNGTTVFFDHSIRYTFFDFYNESTPAIVEVSGDIPGPRGIRVGDTFDTVLALFPQEENWTDSPFGTIYGNFDPDAEQKTIALSAYVSTYDDQKELTLLTENVFPFLMLFFKDDILTHYKIFLISAS